MQDYFLVLALLAGFAAGCATAFIVGYMADRKNRRMIDAALHPHNDFSDPRRVKNMKDSTHE